MRRALLAGHRVAWVGLALLFAAATPALGQLDLGAIGGNLSGAPAAAQTPVTIEAHIAPAKNGHVPQLVVTADIGTGWHIYSLTQKSGGPVRSKITIDSGAGYKLAGDFKSVTPPESHVEPVFNNLPVETHEGQAIWSVPLELTPGTDPAGLSIAGKFAYQACDESSCLPPTSVKFTATFNKNAAAPIPQQPRAVGDAGIYKPGTAHVVIRGHIEPTVATPGGVAKLVITAEPTDGWHVYALADRDPQKISKPTLIALSETAGLNPSPPSAAGKLVGKASTTAPGETERYYEQQAKWTIDLAVPRDAAPGDHKLAGQIGFQTCRDDTGCDLPQAVQFQVTLPVDAQSKPGVIPLVFTPAKSYKQVADSVATSGVVQRGAGQLDLSQIHPAGAQPGEQSLLVMMGYGFLGGLILNLMPCVLPVIGLKILSFVEQSGQSRRHILALNLWYSLGILAVFMALATLPVAFHYFQDKQFGWGQQFAYDGFNITLAAIVFVMALSFLGVWEIPIPGFAGSKTANEMAAKEGAGGAFAKGVLTTILATPCSGPFLTSALAFAVAESPHITYAMFACIGLGMAFPYLLIGAFPRLIRFLPKPGAWMDTFKQLMGFVLLGTVVYLLTVIQWASVVPTVALLIGLWAACWWIGRTPLYAELGAKLRAWTVGAIAAALVAVVAFQWLGPIMSSRFQLAIDRQVEGRIRTMGTERSEKVANSPDREKFELPWEPYSFAKLQELTQSGKTVMVDFTADWCQTCKALEQFVLNTADTREIVQTNGVIPLVVDMTRFPPEEASLLKAISGGQSIPVLAIFPAGRPNEPIVLSNAYTKGILLEKLREAGPSKGAGKLTALNTSR